MKQLGMEFLEEPQARALVDAEAFHVAAIRETSASFAERAHAWVLKHLKGHGPTSGEDLTDGMLAAGIRPPHGDDRAFGSIYAVLHRQDKIEPYGDGPEAGAAVPGRASHAGSATGFPHGRTHKP